MEGSQPPSKLSPARSRPPTWHTTVDATEAAHTGGSCRLHGCFFFETCTGVLWPSPISTTNQAPHYLNSSWPRGSLARRASRGAQLPAGLPHPSLPAACASSLAACGRRAPAPPRRLLPLAGPSRLTPPLPGNPPPASRHRQLAVKWRLRVDGEPPPVYGESQDCCFLTTLMFWIHGLWLRALGLGFGLNDVVIWGFHCFCRSWGY